MKYLFTSESVGEGHPDKVCDQISDSILDNALSQDKNSRVAIETFACNGAVIIGGEMTTSGYIDVQSIVRNTIKRIGYNNPEYGLDHNSCGILININNQSADISVGVNENDGLYKEMGAGDQGMMFGYACNETKELMPAAIQFSHMMMEKAAEVRKSKEIDYLRPDCKGQVTCEYEDGKLSRIHTVVLSHQHNPNVSHETIENDLIEKVIKKALPNNLLDNNTIYHINPTGKFVLGGPQADTGLTGRKIVVDTYGGVGRVGGGAFSGKDPSKVDRSAAYMARYIAKNLVAAGVSSQCEVELAYAIGVSKPVSINVNLFNSSKYNEQDIESLIEKIFPLTPKRIIDHLDLRKPIYEKTASYGHFGRNIFSWEKTDMIDKIKNELNN